MIIKLNDIALKGLTGDIQRLARRAEKLGLTPISLRVLGTEEEREHDADGRETGVITILNVVEVAGTSIKVEGWQFAATLANDTDAGTMVRKAPGFEFDIPSRYFSATTDCEHCRQQRQRKDVFLLRSESGEWKQVGRSCLVDFLGHGNAESVALYWQAMQDLIDSIEEGEEGEEGEYEGRGGVQYFDLDMLMAHAAAMIRVNGYVSSSQASVSGLSTAAQALENITAVRFRNPNRVEVLSCDEERAATIVAWAKSHYSAIDLYKRSEYEHNMSVVFNSNRITRRMVGFAVSAFSAYAKAMEAELRRKAKAEASKSEYVGEVGQRLRGIEVSCVFAREFEGAYGPTYLFKLVDTKGNEYTWWASTHAFDQGDVAIIDATVKNHEEYAGIKQTVLTRCKVKQFLQEAA